LEEDVWMLNVLITVIKTEIALGVNAIAGTATRVRHVKFRNVLMIVLEMEFAEIGNVYAIKDLKVLIVPEK
jgi:hypothetical protein